MLNPEASFAKIRPHLQGLLLAVGKRTGIETCFLQPGFNRGGRVLRQSHGHIERGMGKIHRILRLQQILLRLRQLHLGAQKVGRHGLAFLLPRLSAIKIRLRALRCRLGHAGILTRQQFIGVGFHNIENQFLPRALTISPAPCALSFASLILRPVWPRIVQGHSGGELRAENDRVAGEY